VGLLLPLRIRAQIVSAWPRTARISTAAMRPGSDHAGVCAVRPSTAAAMVIATHGQKIFTIFGPGRPSQGNVAKGSNNAAAAGHL